MSKYKPGYTWPDLHGSNKGDYPEYGKDVSFLYADEVQDGTEYCGEIIFSNTFFLKI